MKKLLALILLLTAAFTLYAGGGKEEPKSPAPAPTQPRSETQQAAPTPVPVPQNPYFDGDGGKGTSLAILIPEGKNLTTAEAYLPTLVQGVFVTDLSKFSAISVLDRQNLERVLQETESGIYRSEADFVQLGEIANVGYALTGSLTKTASGFAMQIQIADTANGLTKASYTGSCTAQELENFTGIRKASLDLLTQMGVELTAKGREELTGIGAQQAINAETALAKGITAQRSGTTVETLAYYYQAAAFDPTLAEAVSRASVLSSNISSGNIGQNVRNDIAWRREWVNLIAEAEAYFKSQIMFELVYDPTLIQGKIDYQKETVELSFNASLRLNETNLKILDNLMDGLSNTGRQSEWKISYNLNQWVGKMFAFQAALVNDRGETVAITADPGRAPMKAESYGGYGGPLSRNISGWTIYLRTYDEYGYYRPFRLLSWRHYGGREWGDYIPFTFEVKEKDITDTMTLKIVNMYLYTYQGGGDTNGLYGMGDYTFDKSGPTIVPVMTGRYNSRNYRVE
ncbi:hypothetical protein FACS1894142_4320 [Spirochaetia bacterium]|nr:hypothetical protein FACS1894142_4320 [Spirochaetia bacterium]